MRLDFRQLCFALNSIPCLSCFADYRGGGGGGLGGVHLCICPVLFGFYDGLVLQQGGHELK